jgi:hypothetical protein
MTGRIAPVSSNSSGSVVSWSQHPGIKADIEADIEA